LNFVRCKMENKFIKGSITVFIALLIFFGLSLQGLIINVIDSQNEIIDQQNQIILLEEKIISQFNTVNIGGVDIPVDVHFELYHYRDGVLIDYCRQAGVLTTVGKNWIEDQLGDSAGTEADWIGLSNSTSSPSSAWNIIPSEITTGAMGRAQGTYADNGDGNWNITKSFSPTESNSTQLVGLYYSDWPATTLVCSDTITVTHYQNGDTVEIRVNISVS